MSQVDEAVDCFCRGAACSQAILGTYGPALGLPREQAMKLASGFAGGMRLGETCGAVTGAFMLLGLKYAADNCDQRDKRENIYAVIRQFTDQFRKRDHSIVCKELIGCDISTPQGAQEALQKGVYRQICPDLVRHAAEIIEQMMGL
jgi:C_GCAxxG_C_C family probable redox protein